VIAIFMLISSDVLACSVLSIFSYVVMRFKLSNIILLFLGGSLHDEFSLLVIGDRLYISDLINRFVDLFLSPS
jgi:hypothetical protein